MFIRHGKIEHQPFTEYWANSLPEMLELDSEETWIFFFLQKQKGGIKDWQDSD